MKNTLIIFSCLFFFGFSVKSDINSIVGTYYCSIYSINDFKENIVLKHKISSRQDSIYKKENDIGWKFEFHKNGEIKITDLQLYYDGFERISLTGGSWKKLSEEVYQIRFDGKSFNKLFSKKEKYILVSLENGDKKMIIRK